VHRTRTVLKAKTTPSLESELTLEVSEYPSTRIGEPKPNAEVGLYEALIALLYTLVG